MGEIVNESTNVGQWLTMEENEVSVHTQFPPNAFGRLFWDQQMKAAQVSCASAMRWD